MDKIEFNENEVTIEMRVTIPLHYFRAMEFLQQHGAEYVEDIARVGVIVLLDEAVDRANEDGLDDISFGETSVRDSLKIGDKVFEVKK